jgi:hypothetical protein
MANRGFVDLAAQRKRDCSMHGLACFVEKLWVRSFADQDRLTSGSERLGQRSGSWAPILPNGSAHFKAVLDFCFPSRDLSAHVSEGQSSPDGADIGRTTFRDEESAEREV